MKPDAVTRFALVVEDVLAAIVVPVDGPRCAIRELAFAELHAVDSEGASLTFVGALEKPALALSMSSKFISGIRFQKATGSAAEHADWNKFFLRKLRS
jgi:hypothetical protein